LYVFLHFVILAPALITLPVKLIVDYVLLQHRKPTDGMLMGSSSRSPVGDGPGSPKYSDKLSPAVNNYLSEASRQEVRVSRYRCYLKF
jgi:hypothetical protein